MRTLRCSTMPRILMCPASLQAPEVEIETDSEASRLGSAVHEALAAMVREEDTVDFRPLAGRWRVQMDDLMPLFYIGRRIYEQYRGVVKVLKVEEQMRHEVVDGYVVSGKMDILGNVPHVDGTFVVWDWKSGSPSAEYRDQLVGYAVLASAGILDFEVMDEGSTQVIKTVTVWLRDQAVEIEDIGQAEMTDWLKRFNHAIAHQDQYGPSPAACMYCPRQHECPARTALIHSAAADFLEGASSEALPPAQLASLRPRAQMLQKALDNYDAVLRSTIEEYGPQPLGDGRELGFNDRRKETIHLAAAIPVLENWFGDGREMDAGMLKMIASALTVGKGKLTKMIGAAAEKGRKGKDIEAFLEDLRGGNAITEAHFKVLSVRKPKAITAE